MAGINRAMASGTHEYICARDPGHAWKERQRVYQGGPDACRQNVACAWMDALQVQRSRQTMAIQATPLAALTKANSVPLSHSCTIPPSHLKLLTLFPLSHCTNLL